MTQTNPIREQVACSPKGVESGRKSHAPVPLSPAMLGLVGGGLPRRGGK
jgi:hypothetical protein